MADGIRVNAVNPGTADTPWVARLLDVAPDPSAERAALEARQPHGRLVYGGGGGGRSGLPGLARGRVDHRHRAGGGRRDGRTAPASPDVSTPTGRACQRRAGRRRTGQPDLGQADPAPALDAHVHVWDLAARPQPWTDGLPVLQRSFGLDDVAGDLRAAGQDGVIVVQTVASAAETRELLALAAAQPLVAGVVGWADLSRPDPADQLLAAQAAPGGRALVGVRHQLQEEPDQEWLARPQVRDGLRAVAAAGLAYDLVISPGQLPLVTETVTALPEVRFVLDHAGKPPIAAGNLGGGKAAAWTGGMAAWAADLRALAAWPNVAVKLSGLVTEADWESWTPAQLGPVMEYVLAQFGPDRTMVGSDWPVCLLAASYAQVMAAVAPVLDGLTPAERTAVRGGTARAWYRLDEHRPGA